MRAGIIVAGGHSARFGNRDKVLTDLAGVPMIRRVADRLTQAAEELVVNCRAEQVTAIDAALSGMEVGTNEVRFAPDPTPGLGPMVGIHAGLSVATAEYAAVVAADMPLLDPMFVSYLFDRAAGHDAAVPQLDGWLQPTQAVYRTDAMKKACVRTLEEGERSVAETLADLDWILVEESEVRERSSAKTFTNINTREEFDAVAKRLR